MNCKSQIVNKARSAHQRFLSARCSPKAKLRQLMRVSIAYIFYVRVPDVVRACGVQLVETPTAARFAWLAQRWCWWSPNRKVTACEGWVWVLLGFRRHSGAKRGKVRVLSCAAWGRWASGYGLYWEQGLARARFV